MQRYYILLKATGAGGWPGWLPYRLDADSAEQAVEKAKEQAENHYPEYEKFEVQAIEIERICCRCGRKIENAGCRGAARCR